MINFQTRCHLAHLLEEMGKSQREVFDRVKVVGEHKTNTD
jgi:hypothetical protein